MNNFIMMNNNPMNFNMNMNMNNNLLPNMIKDDDFDNLINIQFEYDNRYITNIQLANKKLTINELLNLYLKKINKIEFVNNYDNYFFFYYNGEELNKKKEINIENLLRDYCKIKVLEKKNLIAKL